MEAIAAVSFEATILGSGGWMATPERATSSLLGRFGEHVALFDAGTGVSHLTRDRSLLSNAKHLTVLISHFHLDHVAGLTYLPALDDDVTISIYAPGRLLIGTDSRSVLETLVGPPYLSATLSSFARGGVNDLHEGQNDVAGLPVSVRVQPHHPGGSVAFRVENLFAYCTDTTADDENIAFVRGVGVLVHEAWLPSGKHSEHCSAADAANIAAQAGVGRLFLSHINPLHGTTDELLTMARSNFASTTVGHDLLRIR